MNCRIESERFFDSQGAKAKIAAGVAKATSKTISGLTTQSRRKKSRSNAKALLLETRRLLNKKRGIALKLNNFTFSIFPFSPSRFTLHASPFSRSAVTQEFPVDTCNPYIPNEPNLKTSGPTVTLDMIRTYNDN